MARDDSRTQDVSVTTDTFLTLITQTNELLNSLRTEVITANGAVAETGATSTDERHAILFGRFAANTLVATNDIRGGNNTTSDLLTVSSNVNCNGQLSQIFSDLNITNNGTGTGLNQTFVIDVTDVTSNGETTTVTSNTLFRYTDETTALDIKNNAGATTIDVITDDYVANTETTIISGNTSLYFNDDTELAVSIFKNASSNVNITADDFYVTTVDTIQANTDETTVRSNTHFKYVTSDSSAIHITENGSSLETIDITADLLNINTANVDIDGTGLHTIAGNVSFDTGVLFVDAINNEVGINSTNPDATLDLNGTANVSSNVWIGGNINVDGLTNTIEGNTLFDADTLVVDGLNDKIGINKAVPVSILDVVGNTHITGDTDIDSNLNVDGTVTWTENDTTHLLSGNVNFDSATLFVNNSQNKVGIGITPGASSAKLQVSGTANVSSNVWIGGNTTIAGTSHTVAGNTNFDAGTLFVDGNANEVGIGTTTPDAKLQVVGTANVSSNVWIGGNTTIAGTSHTVAGNTNFDSGTLFVDSVNNRIGINDFTPSAALDITGALNTTGNATIGATLDVNGNGTHTIAGNTNFDSNTLVVRGDNNRVGINTASPVNTLDVTGTGRITSNMTVGGTLDVTGITTLSANTVINGIITHKTDVVYDVQSTSITGSNITVYTLDCAVFGSGKFSAQVVEGVNRQCTEFVVAANTTVATLTVYATVSTKSGGSDLGDFSVVISDNDALIRYNRVGSNSQDVTISATTFKI